MLFSEWSIYFLVLYFSGIQPTTNPLDELTINLNVKKENSKKQSNKYKSSDYSEDHIGSDNNKKQMGSDYNMEQMDSDYIVAPKKHGSSDNDKKQMGSDYNMVQMDSDYIVASKKHGSSDNDKKQMGSDYNKELMDLDYIVAPEEEAKCSGKKLCRPKVQCVLSSLEVAPSECQLPGKGKGYCCENIQEHYRSTRYYGAYNDYGHVRLQTFEKKILQRPKGISEKDVKRALQNVKVPKRPTGKRQSGSHNLFTRPRDADYDILAASYRLLFAKNPDGSPLYSSPKLDDDEDEIGLNSENSDAIAAECIWETTRKPDCDNVPRSRDGTREYRTIDGSCNNVDNPLWGLAGTPLGRMKEPGSYTPFEGLPRAAVDGGDLPSARLVSNVFFKEGANKTDRNFTHLLMQLGQFLDHDLAHVAAFDGPLAPLNSDTFNIRRGGHCCSGPDRFDWPEDKIDTDRCFPIKVPEVDPIWGPNGTRGVNRECMGLARTRHAPTLDCKAGAREQTNDLSHWVDMSMIYGSTPKEMRELRNPSEMHLLLVTHSNNAQEELPLDRAMLPQCFTQDREETNLMSNKDRAEVDICKGCRENQKVESCAFSGDIRTNEQPGLSAMHTIFMREHNRVAEELLGLTALTKEEIFEEARRIVIAEWQHIVYQEFLPTVIGKSYMESNSMLPLSSGYSSGYNPSIVPMISNEFTTAAFRFGHTLVYDTIPQRDHKNKKQQGVDLKTVFDNASTLLQPNFLDNTLRGLVGDPMPAFDLDFAEDVLHNLFEDDLDLPAINIQRGRDHALWGYNHYREKCLLLHADRFGAVGSFEELSEDGLISNQTIDKLKKMYNHINDVDLFVGGMIEKVDPEDDSLLGPTFKCIMGDQFRRLKEGDRFWYENGQDPATRLSVPQLNQIRKASLARILCDNSDIGWIQPLPLWHQGKRNKRVPCNNYITIPRLDLSVFVG